jgi:acetylornithine deacetylase/succinyl-diaminopimelate desuccinylase-like protein
MTRLCILAATTIALASSAFVAAPAHAQTLTTQQQMAVDIYKELIEINTVTATGDTERAADAMAAWLRASGFDAADVQVFKPAPRKGNLVARLRGNGARRPILLLAHLDVVEAKAEDWTVDPFKLIEKDGFFYGRGTADDKFMAAAFVANMARYKLDDYKPDRDIILVLDTDEEIGDRDSLGIQWLLKNKRGLIDAEFALNEGGSVALKGGKAFGVGIQTSEKVALGYRLEVKNPGGHSSLPTQDNAIYHLAEGLARLSKFAFPIKLNETTRAFFERAAELESPLVAADIRSVISGAADPEALSRLSANPLYNAQLRTTCVPTLLAGGHAFNALPQVARSFVHCRLLPGEPVADVKTTLERVIADPQISVSQIGQPVLSLPSPLNEEVMAAIKKLAAEFWPGAPVGPIMAPASSDAMYMRNAGIPTYGHSGLAGDIDDMRIHGKDERVLVKSFFEGVEYQYRLVKALAGGK